MEYTDKQFTADVLREAERQEAEFQASSRPFVAGKLEIEKLIQYWEKNRPKMAARLKKLGIMKEFAFTRINRADDRLEENLNAGMYITEAREDAAKIKLMWPEEMDEEYRAQSEEEAK